MRKLFPISLILLVAMLLAACGAQAEPTPEPVVTEEVIADEPMEEEAVEPPSIAEIAAQDGRFTTLVAALQAAGLVDTLSGAGAFTVFAPTDDAFAALPEGTIEGLLEDTDALTNILLYHVVDGKVLAEDAAGLVGKQIATLSGESFTISSEMDNLYINDAQIIITDIEASNGVIHVIDSVLLPPAEEMSELPSIAEIAVEDGRFTTLVAALDAAGLVDTLSGEGAFTVFAPTDDAFAALPEGTVEGLLEDTETLTDILLYHVVDGTVMAADVVALDGQEVPALNGDMLTVTVADGNVRINESNVIITDIEASNGVIHVIDAVLLPPTDDMAELPSIAEIAVEDGRFNTLVAALDAAGLVETLSGEGAFTVFAPTDDAFAALPEGTVEGLLEDTDALTNILLYHVVDGTVMAADVVGLDGQEVPALSGDMLLVTVADGSVMINESNVIITDIEASNGVIHVIDAVLIPSN